MTEGTVIAYHGWGFESSCWDLWKSYLPPGFKLMAFERGYFSKQPQAPFFPTGTSPKVVFCHSFGLHSCPVEVLEAADILIIFSGFMQFHPVDEELQRRSRRVLSKMIEGFKEKPKQVLRDFYRNAAYPDDPLSMPAGKLQQELLLEDLKKLGRSEITPDSLKSVRKIAILHGSKDRIVAKDTGRELFGKLRKQARYTEIKACGHALPFTHHKQCWSLIKPEIEQSLKHE